MRGIRSQSWRRYLFCALLSFLVASTSCDYAGLDGLISMLRLKTADESELSSAMQNDSESTSRKLLDQTATKQKPQIYIYEPPRDKWEHFTNFTEFGDVSDSYYGLDQLLPQLLRASPHYTKDPNAADFFFVEGWWAYGPRHIKDGLKIIREMYPYWDKKGGADHIFVVSGDQARCEFYSSTEEIQKSIVIHHYGRLVRESKPWVVCDVSSMWGDGCDEEMMLAEAAIARKPIEVSRKCHLPLQDIIVPPTCYEPAPDKVGTHHFKTPYLNPELRGINRSIILSYSGKINLNPNEPPWRDAGYSFGARQTVYKMFKNTTGFSLLDHHTHETYWRRKSASIFCLAASGWGWGGRMKNAVTRGCIPLIIQDGILVEWEESLPLKEYALRVPLWMVHKTPDILNTFIDTGRVAKMQKALDCTWKLHWWRRMAGRPGSEQGRAFEILMCTLKRRMILGVGQQMIPLDVNECTIECGDGKKIRLNDDGVNGV